MFTARALPSWDKGRQVLGEVSHLVKRAGQGLPSGCPSTGSALPGHFIEGDRSCRAHVQRADAALHRDAGHVVARTADEGSDPLPLASQHESDAGGEIDLGEIALAVCGEGHRPNALLLQVFEGARKIRDPRYRKPLEGARRRLERARRHSGGAVLGEDEAMRSQGLRAPGQRTEVLRIGHAVEDDQERFLGRGRQQILEVRVAELGKLRADPLMSAARRSPLQFASRSVLHANAGLVRRPDDALCPLRGPAVVTSLDEDADDFLRVRADRFEDRIRAVDEPIHSTVTGTVTSRFCRSQSFSVQMKKLS